MVVPSDWILRKQTGPSGVSRSQEFGNFQDPGLTQKVLAGREGVRMRPGGGMWHVGGSGWWFVVLGHPGQFLNIS